ncbi:MAG: flagellar protein FlgN [Deltaproteobacteria bacterium]|nr:flagellar protein FlgN [Deltaproteobacteria bacterium]
MEAREQVHGAETALQKQIRLHQELLECLEKERQALVAGQEEAILSLAAEKSGILAQLHRLAEAGETEASPEGDRARLQGLRRRVAQAHSRNHLLIAASLALIQQFLGQFQPPGAGTYQPSGQVAGTTGAVLFERQA